MENVQINKLNMGQVTLACLQDEENALLLEDVPAIGEETAALDRIIAEIVACSRKQTARTGFTAQKQAAKDSLADAAWVVRCGLAALASKTANAGLAAQVKFSRSGLERGRESEYVNRCDELLALGEQNAGALAAKYDVEAKDLKALRDGITAFTDLQPKPRQGRSTSASATAQLDKLFRELDMVLTERLDPLLAKFKARNPALYQEYRTARTIVDTAASHEGAAAVPGVLPKAA